jgi:hypothetical protein
MTETKVTRIGVPSLAAFSGVITWGITLIFGWPILFLEGVIPGMGIGLFLIIVLSSMIWGLILGAVIAVIYNFVALFMGGVVLELETAG